jgi:AraC-like DNA-binding protein
MIYQKFEPDQLLKPFVECYFAWESKTPLDKEMVVESPPNGFCSIVINSGDPYILNGMIEMVGVVFKPAALSTFWGLDGFLFVEERVDLFNVLTQQYMTKFIEKINNAVGAVEKIKALEEFLLHHFNLTRPEPDYIDTAANAIVEKWGMLHVQQLVKESCMSRRTFERRFFQKVGLSPKYYARIRRIGYVCSLFIGKKKVNWPEIFYEAGFYDQAHFIKDFEEFTGRSPQQYLAENTELANYVDKPTTQSLH